jgi:hypothetical protein
MSKSTKDTWIENQGGYIRAFDPYRRSLDLDKEISRNFDKELSNYLTFHQRYKHYDLNITLADSQSLEVFLEFLRSTIDQGGLSVKSIDCEIPIYCSDIHQANQLIDLLEESKVDKHNLSFSQVYLRGWNPGESSKLRWLAEACTLLQLDMADEVGSLFLWCDRLLHWDQLEDVQIPIKQLLFNISDHKHISECQEFLKNLEVSSVLRESVRKVEIVDNLTNFEVKSI